MKIVCLGDSLTFGYGAAKEEKWISLFREGTGYEVLNRGVCGDTTGGMLARFYNDVIVNKPDAVLIMGGANDFTMDCDPAAAAANVLAMSSHAVHNGIKPIIAAPPLCDAENIAPHWGTTEQFLRRNGVMLEYRDRLLKAANMQHAPFWDFCGMYPKGDELAPLYFDGLHFTAKGHVEFAKIACELAGDISNM